MAGRAEKIDSISNKRLLLRRKLTVASVVVATFLFLLFYNLGSYFFIKKMGRHLEQSLDSRLKTAASLAAQIIELDVTNIYDASEHPLLRIVLTRIKNDNELEAAYLIDSSYNVILDSRLDLELSASRSYIVEDSSAIRQALVGSISTSQLHTVAGNHFKSVYAPVNDLFGNSAILVLEANAEFFDMIRFFKKGLLIGSVTSGLLLILLTLFLIGATSLFLKTEEQLQKSRRLAAMGQMAATVAHEIRNPLGIIKSTADVLREKYHSGDEPDELFGFINDEVQRLNRLVNDFLTLSREPKLNRVDENLIGIVENAIRQFKAEPDENIRVEFRATTNKAVVNCDRDKIHQVLLNLLLNARQALEKSENGQIKVELSAEKIKGKEFAKVEIADNGPGLPGDSDEIFDPFYTTRTKGTGLGLAVSRNIIELHGGRIEAENRPQGGAVLRFYLPMKK